MNNRLSIQKVLFLVMGTCFTLWVNATIGIIDEKGKSSKYSLSQVKSHPSKTLTFPSLSSASFQYKGTLKKPILNSSKGSSNAMRFENDHSTFIFPYTIKVKVPFSKFKTPSPQQ